jgi:hypothetical protein
LADQLSGASLRWWERHRDTIIELGHNEATDMLAQLARRQPYAARVEIIARMDQAQWVAYRDGVTEKLSGIAKRRAEMLDALRELGWLLARVLGRQLERAL